MLRNIRFAVLTACAAWVSLAPYTAAQQNKPAKSGRLPRPQVLGSAAPFERDASTGELRSSPSPATGVTGGAAIRSSVALVEVACTVIASDGTQLRGLNAANFRLFEDGVQQEIASFDASATPASIALILDASPSIYHELSEMRAAARALAANLSPADEVSVVSFSAEPHLLLPFSTDRTLLDRALDSKNLTRVENSPESNIYRSVFVAARELFRGRVGRRAIVLLTDGQDSGLGLTWDASSASPHSGQAEARLTFDDVARELGADGIALFIVSTENRPRAMTGAWLTAHQNDMLVSEDARRLGMPHYTLYLAELARRAGGQLFFLRQVGNLGEIYRRIAVTINAQYTLGYYPISGAGRPGWRSLRVEMVSGDASSDQSGAPVPPGVRLEHRNSYYVPALR